MKSLKIMFLVLLLLLLSFATATPALADDMALTLDNGTCVLVPHNAGNPGPAPVPSGLSVANT